MRLKDGTILPATLPVAPYFDFSHNGGLSGKTLDRPSKLHCAAIHIALVALHFQLKTLQITMVCTPCYLNSHCRQTSRSGPYCSMECRSRLCGGPPVQIDSSTMQFEAPVVSDHNFDGQPPWAREVTNLTTWRGCKQDCLSPGF